MFQQPSNRTFPCNQLQLVYVSLSRPTFYTFINIFFLASLKFIDVASLYLGSLQKILRSLLFVVDPQLQYNHGFCQHMVKYWEIMRIRKIFINIDFKSYFIIKLKTEDRIGLGRL